MIEWRFPSNDFGQKYGINDNGIADFQDDPIRYLAREIIQNSLDACINYPVIVEFNSFSIPTSNIPGKEQLLDAFIRCREYWSVLQNEKKTKDFFDEAIKQIEKENCNVLRISDFNTKGLLGSREEINTDFNNLIKSTGASDKQLGSGGAYGIGKYATFACSYFQTVFYSTLDKFDIEASQGVARLVTFKRADGETTQNTFFYGEERNEAIPKQLHLDTKFNRFISNSGTDIYIPGFKQFNDNWKEDIIYSVLDSFLYSIWINKLEVIIDGEKISKDSLPIIFNKYEKLFSKSNIIKYYDLFSSDQTVWGEKNVIEDGKIKIGLLLNRENNSNKTLITRQTGMKIKEQPRSSKMIPYTAFLYIEGLKLNNELKIIENQKHDNWDIKRAKNTNRARTIVRRLYSTIEDFINEIAGNDNTEYIDAVGVGGYLPDLSDNTSNSCIQNTLSDKILDINIRQAYSSPSKSKSKNNKTKKRISKEIKEIDGEVIIDLYGNEWTTTNEGKHNNNITKNKDRPKDNNISIKDGTGKIKVPKKVEIEVENFRFMNIDKSKGRYIISFIPKKTTDSGVVEIYLSGETVKYEANIINAKGLNTDCIVENSKLTNIKFIKDQPLRISIQVDFYDYCALEVDVYAIEK